VKTLDEDNIPSIHFFQFATAIPPKQMLPTYVAIMLPEHRRMLPIRAGMLPICVAGWQHVEEALNTHGAFCVIYLSFSL
jgi:hypothetical protein